MPKQAKPTIYWFHSHFLYWMGGTKYVFEVIRRLSREYHIIVIVEDASKLALSNYQKANIPLISLTKPTSTSMLYWLLFPLELAKTSLRIQKIIDTDSSPKVIISSMFPMNYVATLLHVPHLQLCFEPFAFFHDPSFIQGFPPLKRLLIQVISFLYSWLDIRASRAASHILTLNQVTQKVIRETYQTDSTPIYTGIDTNHFRPYVSLAVKNRYKGKKIIIHSTDYTPVKGTDKMLALFAKLKRQVPSAHLLITSTIPNSSAKAPLENLAQTLGIESSVEFLGFVDYDLLPQLYSLASVLVQCSFSERSGTTSMALPVKEALACGTPCLRSPVTTEDVIDGRSGYLVDPRNEKLMLQRLIDILNLSPKRRAQWSTLARQTIVSRYSWDNTVAAVSRIIKTIRYDQTH